MSKIRLYLDEDVINRALVESLRNSGVEVMTTSDANKLSCTDEEQLIYATEQNRVIYTYNVGDFCRLHSLYMAQEVSHAGIILGVQQRYSVGQQLRGILNLMATKSAEDMRNQLEFLNRYIMAE